MRNEEGRLMGAQEPLRGVGKTALGVARVRAEENRRADRLFDDPYAQAFMDAAPGAFDKEERAAPGGGLASLGAAFYVHGVVRTKFFDDYLLATCASGCRQVVLLAAGLDARAFRLPWPEDVRLFEIDLPEVLAFKEEVLAGQRAVPRCERVVVPADLSGEWPLELTKAGFRPDERTAWLAEGLLVYLSGDEAARLLGAVGWLSAPGSRLSFEHGAIVDASLLVRARAIPSMDRYAALWKGGLGEDAAGWLNHHGWHVQTHDLASVAASYGRRTPDSSGGGFLTAVHASS
jgi:methyltransferase (TIGR00027 family)